MKKEFSCSHIFFYFFFAIKKKKKEVFSEVLIAPKRNLCLSLGRFASNANEECIE
jgi:hypothetical protein